MNYQLAIYLVLWWFTLKGSLKCVTDSNSLLIKTQETLSQSSTSTVFTSIQGVYGEVSGRLYLATISALTSCTWNAQVISRVKFNGLSSPTVDWTKYFTTLSSKSLMNLGVTHNEYYLYSLQYTGSDGIFLKIDASNGYLSKSWKITGDTFVDAFVYNTLVTDSSDSYLYFRSATATKLYSYDIAIDTFQTITLGLGNIYAFMPVGSIYSVLFGAHVPSTCAFNFGKTYYYSPDIAYYVMYKTFTFAESWTDLITGTFAKDSSEDSAYLMVSLQSIKACKYNI